MRIAGASTESLRTSAGRLAVFAVGFVSPMVVFGVLAEEIHDRERFGWDGEIIRSVHDVRLPGLHALMELISETGGFPGIQLAALAIAIGLLAWRRVGDAVFVLGALIGAETLTQWLKTVFARPRPALAYAPPEHTFSFPSGHATDSAAVVTAVVALLWPTRWRWWAVAAGVAFVLAVGVSRVYLGVHFPSDVVGGWCLGLAWIALIGAVRTFVARRAGVSA